MSSTSPVPIEVCIERWHRYLDKSLTGGLDAVLHPDVVFLSPVVFTPQLGREITKIYLTAAEATLGGGNGSSADRIVSDDASSSFRYTKQILDGHHAVLEFETTIDETLVNGVDIITCDDDAMITEFRVMVRPLRAMNAVHAQMMAMLEQMRTGETR